MHMSDIHAVAFFTIGVVLCLHVLCMYWYADPGSHTV